MVAHLCQWSATVGNLVRITTVRGRQRSLHRCYGYPADIMICSLSLQKQKKEISIDLLPIAKKSLKDLYILYVK